MRKIEQSTDYAKPLSNARNDVWLRTVCLMCQNGCGIRVHVVNGTVIKLEGDPENPHTSGRMCAKGNAGLMGLYDPNRIAKPLRRTNPQKGLGVDPRWQEIEWDEALDIVARKLREVYEEDPRQLLIYTFDSTGFRPLGGAFAAAFGTPNVTSGAARYYCGNGFHPITYMTHGAWFTEPDLDYCNYLLLIGSQNGFVNNTNPMGLTQKMADARLRGMKVVVVDPVCCHAAAKADEWIPILPGTDGALALGMLNVIVNELGICDREFLQKYTNAGYLIGSDGLYCRDQASGKPLVWDAARGTPALYDEAEDSCHALEGEYEVGGQRTKPAFQLLKKHLRQYPLERVEKITTVPAAVVHRLATEFATAARVGSKIVIRGQELPYRPVCANWNRGPIAHKHAMHTGIAIQLLNIVLGAMDVPGGHMGISIKGPDWAPSEGPDGILMAAPKVALSYAVYPPRKVKRPQTLDLMELFPVSTFGGPVVPGALRHPEEFGLDYRCKMLIHCRANALLSTVDPQYIAEAIAGIPFMVSFATVIDETAEFADIVLPDTHYLERLDPFPSILHAMMAVGEGSRCYAIRQPVVRPYGQSRHWAEVLAELADRIGIREDFYRAVNVTLQLDDERKLDADRSYSYAEIVDRTLRSTFGAERGLEWFKAQGYVDQPRSIEEAYPRPFFKGRIPLYVEHYIRTGREVAKVTRELGIPWETSDYQPLPDWNPCEAHGTHDPDYGFIVVNFKTPFHTHSFTAENPWLEGVFLQSLWEPDAVLINSSAAAARNIKSGDRVRLETERGHCVEGVAKVTECVHPEVVATIGLSGNWATGTPVARGKGLHFNALLPYDLKRMDYVSAAMDSCVRVRVRKA